MENEENQKLSHLGAQIHALLFYKAQGVALADICKQTEASEEEVLSAIFKLKEFLHKSGVVLVEQGDEYELRTASEQSTFVESVRKNELEGPLGKAALETLSVVLYHAPVTRARVDYIRGVNSQFILRRLSIRGLIQKKTHPTRSNTNIYEPTLELLGHLGLENLNELPEYATVRGSLEHVADTLVDDPLDGGEETGPRVDEHIEEGSEEKE